MPPSEFFTANFDTIKRLVTSRVRRSFRGRLGANDREELVAESIAQLWLRTHKKASLTIDRAFVGTLGRAVRDAVIGRSLGRTRGYVDAAWDSDAWLRARVDAARA